MKHYTCDICGEVFDHHDAGCSTAERPLGAPGEFGMAASGIDVCPRCMRIGRGVAFKAAMLNAWRDAVAVEKDNG